MKEITGLLSLYEIHPVHVGEDLNRGAGRLGPTQAEYSDDKDNQSDKGEEKVLHGISLLSVVFDQFNVVAPGVWAQRADVDDPAAHGRDEPALFRPPRL